MWQEIEDYYWRMAVRQRLLQISQDSRGLCTFFLLTSEADLPRFYCRPEWSTPPDDATGPLCYVDKLVGVQFSRAVWRELERVLTERFPQLERAVWYRPRQARDMRYTYVRRLDAQHH